MNPGTKIRAKTIKSQKKTQGYIFMIPDFTTDFLDMTPKNNSTSNNKILDKLYFIKIKNL